MILAKIENSLVMVILCRVMTRFPRDVDVIGGIRLSLAQVGIKSVLEIFFRTGFVSVFMIFGLIRPNC